MIGFVKSVCHAGRIFIRWQGPHVFTYRITSWKSLGHQYLSSIIHLVMLESQCPMESWNNLITPSRWALGTTNKAFCLSLLNNRLFQTNNFNARIYTLLLPFASPESIHPVRRNWKTCSICSSYSSVLYSMRFTISPSFTSST